MGKMMSYELLHILILHQTTTSKELRKILTCCFISWFYIKPQLSSEKLYYQLCCFISWFYIKPQHSCGSLKYCLVASYLDSTSNHNSAFGQWPCSLLLHILILHQTTTILRWNNFAISCFISWFYIKPQLSTPYFNRQSSCFISWFYIKPQQAERELRNIASCFISWFYIKPQPLMRQACIRISCFISWFYIKPQLVGPYSEAI